MGLVSHVIVYKLGKSRGKKKERSQTPDTRDQNCINYARFCEKYGSCDGQVCEYDDEE